MADEFGTTYSNSRFGCKVTRLRIGWAEVRIPVGGDFPISKHLQIGSGARPIFTFNRYPGFFVGVERPERDV